jgi:hypothetical protein
MLAAAAGLAAAGGVGCAEQARDKERPMTAEIWSATDDQLKTAQAKITYLGEQEKPIPTVVFAAQGHAVSMVRFLSVQHSKKPYANDKLPYTKSFTVTLAEFRRILEAVRPLAAAALPNRNPFLSFSVLVGAGESVVGQELSISHNQGKQFLTTIDQSISPANTPAHAILGAEVKNLYP